MKKLFCAFELVINAFSIHIYLNQQKHVDGNCRFVFTRLQAACMRAALLFLTAFLAHATMDASCARTGAERTPTRPDAME
jgi:hypothetical protein